LYLSAIVILIRPFVLPANMRPKLGLAGALVLLATAFSIVCIAYAYFVEPYQLDVKYVKLQIPNMPASGTPLKFVQVSDTHCDGQVRLEDRLIEEIERIKPDVILFTGDAANSREGVPIFNALAAKLKKIAPTFAVKGDWDFALHPLDVLVSSKLDVVSGYRTLNIKGVTVCITGTDSGTSCKASLAKAPKSMLTVMMYHNPDGDVILNNDTNGIDLYVCGHTHGGQIALPFYGALITQSIQGKKYESGLHRIGNTWMYINRGVGMEGHFPRFRFFAKPELTVFELTGTQK